MAVRIRNTDYSSSESDEEKKLDYNAEAIHHVRTRKLPQNNNIGNVAGGGLDIIDRAPVTKRDSFTLDTNSDNDEDVHDLKRGYVNNTGAIAPVVSDLESTDVLHLPKNKPVEPLKKKTGKGFNKGESLTSEAAVSFMIKERQMLDQEFATLRRENDKLKKDLQTQQQHGSGGAVVEKIVEKIIIDPNSKKYIADVEKLKIENDLLRKRKSEMEVLLKQRKEVESTDAKAAKPSSIFSFLRAPSPRVDRNGDSSPEVESDDDDDEVVEEEEGPESNFVPLASKPSIPIKETGTKLVSNKSVGSKASSAAPSVGIKSTSSFIPLTSKKFSALPSVLWEGGKLWKIPYNGKGMPEERMVMIKRSPRPGSQARPVRVLAAGEVSSDGAVSIPVAYIEYPPTLIWYNADKPNESKFARELVLVEGAYVVEGHQTPAFWKLVNRGSPMPPKELCFSIVTSNRTLDFAAESLREANIWKNAIHILLVMLSTNKEWAIDNLHRSAPTWHHDSLVKPSVANTKKDAKDVKKMEEDPSQPADAKSGVMKEQMFTATKLGNFAALDDLLKAGVPVNLMDAKTTDTPLMTACRLNLPVIAKLCLDYGAKNDPHPDFGQTALHAAVASNSFDCVDVILDAAAPSGADTDIVNLPDSLGQTPLHMAAMLGYGNIAELLISHGGDQRKNDGDGKTPIHLSAAGGHVACLALLLDHGGDELIELKDSAGQTPLHLAAEYGHFPCAKLLLETAANPSVRNNSGHTPYAVASARGHHQVGLLLLQYQDSSAAAGSTKFSRNGRGGSTEIPRNDRSKTWSNPRNGQMDYNQEHDLQSGTDSYSVDMSEAAMQPVRRPQMQRNQSDPSPFYSGALPRPHTATVGSPSVPGLFSPNPAPDRAHRQSAAMTANNNDYRVVSRAGNKPAAASQVPYQSDPYNDRSNAPHSSRQRSTPALFEGLIVNKSNSIVQPAPSNGSARDDTYAGYERSYSGSPGRNVVNGDRDMAEYYSYVQQHEFPRFNSAQDHSSFVSTPSQQQLYYSSDASQDQNFYVENIHDNSSRYGAVHSHASPNAATHSYASPSAAHKQTPTYGRTPVQNSYDQYQYDVSPLEEFYALDTHWQVFVTSEGYTYYLDPSSGHSQWYDPREYGLVVYNEEPVTEEPVVASVAPSSGLTPSKAYKQQIVDPSDAQINYEATKSQDVFKQPKVVTSRPNQTEKVAPIRATKRAPSRITIDTILTPDVDFNEEGVKRRNNDYEIEDDLSEEDLTEGKRVGVESAKKKALDNIEYYADVSRFVRRNLAPILIDETDKDDEISRQPLPKPFYEEHIPILDDQMSSPQKGKGSNVYSSPLHKSRLEDNSGTKRSPNSRGSSPFSGLEPESISAIDTFWKQSSSSSQRRSLTPRTKARLAAEAAAQTGGGPLDQIDSILPDFSPARGSRSDVSSDLRVLLDYEKKNFISRSSSGVSANNDKIKSIEMNRSPLKDVADSDNNNEAQLHAEWDEEPSKHEGSDWDDDHIEREAAARKKVLAAKLKEESKKREEEQKKRVDEERSINEAKLEEVRSNQEINRRIQPPKSLPPVIDERTLLRARSFNPKSGGYGNGGNKYDNNEDDDDLEFTATSTIITENPRISNRSQKTGDQFI